MNRATKRSATVKDTTLRKYKQYRATNKSMPSHYVKAVDQEQSDTQTRINSEIYSRHLPEGKLPEGKKTHPYNHNWSYADNQKWMIFRRTRDKYWPKKLDYAVVSGVIVDGSYVAEITGNSNKGNNLECIINAKGETIYLPFNPNGTHYSIIEPYKRKRKKKK